MADADPRTRIVADVQLFGHLHDEHEPAVRAWLANPA